MTSCIVCGTVQRNGLAAWHASCPGCNYESAALQVAINAETEGEPVDEAAREVALKGLRQENFRVIHALARRYARAGARKLLDVGCAHGWFLETARQDFDVLGIEPDVAVGQATAARGLPVRQGYFPDALRADETFDVIVFNDVIEHIPDIQSALTACHARLNAGGLLILNLPNGAGFFYRLSKLFVRTGWAGPFDRMWQKGMPSPHVHYFRPGNLAKLVQPLGFEQVHTQALPSLRAGGLLERMRYAGNLKGSALYLQYAAVLCTLPLLRILPSDIIVSVFRKQ